MISVDYVLYRELLYFISIKTQSTNGVINGESRLRPWCGQPSDRGRLKNRTKLMEHFGITWPIWRVSAIRSGGRCSPVVRIATDRPRNNIIASFVLQPKYIIWPAKLRWPYNTLAAAAGNTLITQRARYKVSTASVIRS